MSEFLLMKEEWEAIYNGLPDKATCGDCRNAIAQAALKKVAVWLSQHTEGRYYPITRWSEEEWEAFKREAGLAEKGEPDANA